MQTIYNYKDLMENIIIAIEMLKLKYYEKNKYKK